MPETTCTKCGDIISPEWKDITTRDICELCVEEIIEGNETLEDKMEQLL